MEPAGPDRGLGRARGTAIAHELEQLGADVVAVQESWVEPDGRTQAGTLAAAFGHHAVTAFELAGFDVYPTAPYWVVNGLISRWPLELVGRPRAARRAR